MGPAPQRIGGVCRKKKKRPVGRALFLRVCGVSAVGEEVELVQQREGEEAPDDQAHHREQRVEHPRRGFRGPPGVVADVFAEEEVQRRDDAACQQVILRNAEEVDLRKSDQRPVAEEHRQHDVDSLRKGQHQPDRECGHTIGKWAMIAAGAVVTKNVKNHALMAGVPAKRIGWVCECGNVLGKDLKCECCHREYEEHTDGLKLKKH